MGVVPVLRATMRRQLGVLADPVGADKNAGSGRLSMEKTAHSMAQLVRCAVCPAGPMQAQGTAAIRSYGQFAVPAARQR